ncbi:MAG TPA: hypothetical protein IAB59_00105 [Candidatus Onthousia faecipullorum]|uniref:Uncharacterized protein n=1 Tax=Candidatus Onthousia faecipullorum TaxID=2840887 RepID=A0A9D1G959_9FIRM|nr:hypothetical protein [Candidatus Onthousia faecipullorum]
MTESQKMLEILHENKRRVREENLNKKKESKIDTILSYIVLFGGATIFSLGIMTLISVIENLPL